MSDEAYRYAVRFSTQAEQDTVLVAHNYLEYSGDPAAALDLHSQFYTEASKLSVFPTRHHVQVYETELFGLELRRILVRNWHLYYHVADAGADGPRVTILYLWPATAEKIDAEAAQRISTNQ